jgi:hypothetical protein
MKKMAKKRKDAVSQSLVFLKNRFDGSTNRRAYPQRASSGRRLLVSRGTVGGHAPVLFVVLPRLFLFSAFSLDWFSFSFRRASPVQDQQGR